MTRITGSLWIFFTLIVIAALTGCRMVSVPAAEKGVMDLRTWDFSADNSVMLIGEWGFQWKEFSSPETIQTHTDFIEVPGKWNGYNNNGRDVPGSGYSTYNLTILMPENPEPLALRIKTIKTAYTLYADGEQIAAVGRPGVDAASSVPRYESVIADFTKVGDRLELVMHVSNYHHRDGGIWDPIELGTESEIRKIHDYSHTNEILVISCIVIMGFYHLTLYALRRRNPATLYFGILCIIIAIRTLTVGDKYAFTILPGVPWEILHKLDYLSFYTAVPLFLLYLRSMFPRDFSKKVVKITMILGAVFSLFVCVTPARIYTWSVQVYQAITVMAFLYAAVVLTQAIRKKREGSVILAIGFLPLFVLIINDILHANQIIITGYYQPWGMLTFLCFQAFIIARRYATTLHTTEKQAVELSREIRERKRLHDELELSHEQFAESRLGTIMGLVKLAEFRDEDTGTHLERIQEYSRLLAAALADHAGYKGYITGEYVHDIHQSSILHDIGKVGVPDAILLKPGPLTPEEFKVIKKHTINGGDTIRNIESRISVPSFLSLGREIAYSHHEKWDGSGYPQGIKGRNIPLSARIVALADVYDAVTSKRPYKEAYTHSYAVSVIKKGKGDHFDPDIVDIFMLLADRFESIRKEISL